MKVANAARKERGLPPLPVAVTAHTFRRTFVTLMLEAGAPLTYVQDQVGHEDTKTTQEIYARVLRRQQRAHVGAAFNELMYGARELAFRAEEDAARVGSWDLLVESPFMAERRLAAADVKRNYAALAITRRRLNRSRCGNHTSTNVL